MRPQRDRRSYYVYIMASLSGTLYIGMTGNLEKRPFEHKFHRIEGFTMTTVSSDFSTGSLTMTFTKLSGARNG